MSVNFSTIRPMDPATISRAPAFSVASQPAASSPMGGEEAPKKKSRWFIKTLATVAVLAAAVGLGRKYMPTTFDPNIVVNSADKWYKQGMQYAQKYIGKAGEFINTNISKAIAWGKNLFNRSAATQTNHPIAP